MICNLCPRHCNAMRTENLGEGICRMGILPEVARAARHMWEEPCISGTKGSGTVFFNGCALGCVFCQQPWFACRAQVYPGRAERAVYAG